MCLCICKSVYVCVCLSVCVCIYTIDYARGGGHYLGSHCDDRYVIYQCIFKYVYIYVCVYAID